MSAATPRRGTAPPVATVVGDPFAAQPLPGRRRRHKMPFARIASEIRAQLAANRRPRAAHVARLRAAAPGLEHAAVADDLAAALRKGDRCRAFAIASIARRSPDTRAEKIVSHRHRFLWVCNPKVASRSIIWALRAADPDALLIRGATVEDIHRTWPVTLDYYAFAFVRHPCTRTYSFHADKLVGAGAKNHPLPAAHHGLAETRTFADACAWLGTPYGSDAFADRHWLSQHRQIRLPDSRLPDYVGRFERLDEDFATVARHLGLPTTDLPVLNTQAGWTATAEVAAALREATAARLSDDTRAQLRERYAEDFGLWDYEP